MNVLGIIIECVILCIVFYLICYLGTGTDKANLNSYRSYPDEVKTLIDQDSEYKDMVKKSNPIVVFISNTLIFLVLFFIMGIFIRTSNYLYNFFSILIIGEVLNAFDLLVIDLLWFRHSKRTRLSKYPNKNIYLDPKNHIISFVKAFVMYIIVALIDGALLLLL